MDTGTATGGNSGSVAVTTGGSTGGAGGAFSVTVGTGDTGTGGSISLTAGSSVIGGKVNITAGAGTSGLGGDLILQGGNSQQSTGGDVIIDSGDSWTGNSSREGIIRIAPTSASFVRIGRSGTKAVKTDLFGDLTVHGNLTITSSMVYQDVYTERIHITTVQDQMVQSELRVPKITGLDAEDIAGTPTSTLTLDAGMGGSQQYVEIGPTEANAINIGGKNAGGAY
eukprot:15842-Pelagococcus_subviridis.AAC.1